MAATEWLSPEELANELGLPVGTIYQWRTKGYGPTGIKVGRHVRYRRTDLDAWAERQLEAARVEVA